MPLLDPEKRREAARLRTKLYRERNPERVKAAQKRSYDSDRERYVRKSCDWAKANPRKVGATNRRHRIKKLYGITEADYEELLHKQGGRCALCHRTPEEHGRRLAVDHVHPRGPVRGLLCAQCNTGLGKLGDTEEGLLRALAYIRGEHPWAA